MIDPCPNIELSLIEPAIFTNEVYYLRDKDYKYEWDDSNLVAKNTRVDCGALIVSVFMDDGSGIDSKLFELETYTLVVFSTGLLDI